MIKEVARLLDEAIARELDDEFASRVLLTEPGTVDVTVDDGVVTLRDQLDRSRLEFCANPHGGAVWIGTTSGAGCRQRRTVR